MAENNHDSDASYLLCMETMSLCFDDHDSVVTNEHSYQSNGDKGLIFDNDISEPFTDLPSLCEESFGMMMERENQHSPKADYLNILRTVGLHLSMRIEALDWIWKVHSHFTFGVLSFCLSMNYLDRFLSAYDQNKSRNWTVQLLALACLSLAIKMEETNAPFPVVLKLGRPKVWFDGRTIQEMEFNVMSVLGWRLYSCIPCTFIDYFLRKITGDHQITSGSLISRSVQVISSTMKDIDFLKFRPSKVAAAVALFVSREMLLIVDLDQAISSCFTQETLKERVMRCLELIQDLAASLDGGSAKSRPESSNGVLEAACFTYNKRRRVREESPED